MALKKISRKKMGELIDEVIGDIRKGDFSRILNTLQKYKIGIHTVDTYSCTFLWCVGACIHIFNSPEENKNIVACMQFLIDHGADVNYRTNDGETVLYLVAGLERSNPEAVEMLIRNGADVNCVDKDGSVPLVRAIAGFKDGYPETVTPLLKAGADPYHKLGEKFFYNTPAEMAAEWVKDNQTQLKTTFFNALKDTAQRH